MFKLKAIYQEKDLFGAICGYSGDSFSSDSDEKRKKSKRKKDSKSEPDNNSDVIVAAIAAGMIVSTLE